MLPGLAPKAKTAVSEIMPIQVHKAYKRRNQRLLTLGYESYSEYLASDDWEILRQQVLERDDRKCVACHKPAKCIHHTKYSRRTLDPRSTPTEALVSLCHSCHRFIEFDKDGTKLPIKRTLRKLRWLCRKHDTALPGRCKSCMKGGGSKRDGLCKTCRSKLTPR